MYSFPSLLYSFVDIDVAAYTVDNDPLSNECTGDDGLMVLKNRNCNTLFLLPMIEAKKEVFLVNS